MRKLEEMCRLGQVTRTSVASVDRRTEHAVNRRDRERGCGFQGTTWPRVGGCLKQVKQLNVQRKTQDLGQIGHRSKTTRVTLLVLYRQR